MPNTHLFSCAQAQDEGFVYCVHPTAQLQPPPSATVLPKTHSAAHSPSVTQTTCTAPAQQTQYFLLLMNSSGAECEPTAPQKNQIHFHLGNPQEI